MTTSLSLRVSYGALIDLLTACRVNPDGANDAEARAEAATNTRAVSIIVAGGYQVGIYRDVFTRLREWADSDISIPDIARLLIDVYGDNPPCRIYTTGPDGKATR